jgi:pilus assembly protein CpaC
MIGHLRRRPAAFVAALASFIIVGLDAAPQAQQAPQAPAAAFSNEPAGAAGLDTSTPTDIDLLVGRSTVLNVGAPIARVSLTVPDVADALVTAPGQILIHGKQPGTISLFVWDRGGAIKTYEVSVRRDLSTLTEQLKQLFPGEPISVTGSGKDVVIAGTVSSKYVIEKAADVAAGYVAKKEDVVNLLKQQEGVASNQVMLRVRFAEVSRSALQELGASFVASGFKSDWSGRTTTGQFPAPQWDEDGKLVFSDFLNLFLFNSKQGLGGVVRALQNKGLFQSLAEPNLIATNGKEASFLAGGEYPYPVVQPSSGGNSVTIMFKEFGIRLNFTPTVLAGDLINLKVRPEVSALDFTNAITLSGFRIPALSTRRTETEVELRDGQTFAIAGLMNNTVTSTMSKIPGIGDVPILGLLFRSKAHQKNQTELVVMITPTIIKRGQMGVSEGLPSPVEPYMEAPEKRLPSPAPYIGSPHYPANQPPAGGSADADAAAAETQVAAKPAAAAQKNTQKSATPKTAAQKPAAQKPAAQKPAAQKPVAQAPAPRHDDAPPVPAAPVVAAAPVLPPPAVAQTTPGAVSPSPAAAVTGPAPASSSALVGSPYDSAPAPAPAVGASAPAPATASHAEGTAPVPAPGANAKAIERAKQQEKKAAELEARERAAAEKKKARDEETARKKAAAEQRQAEKLAKERAKREAEIARKNEEAAREQAGKDQEREKALVEAAARLKQAQVAYEDQLQKVKGGAEQPDVQPASSGSPTASRQ